MEKDATKLVAAALLGKDTDTVEVGGHSYTIPAPTIKRIAGAGFYLSDFGSEKDIKDVVREFMLFDELAKALSWFITGDESLSDKLSEGTLEELLNGIDKAVTLVGIGNFSRLSTLARNVKMTIAKQK